MLAGIRSIAIVINPQDEEQFKYLLGDGSKFGINIQYFKQYHPNGIPEAFTICSSFIKNENVALILGDNIFHSGQLTGLLNEMASLTKGANILAYPVKDPKRYGVVEFTKDGKVKTIVEKPEVPASKYALTGLFFFDKHVIEYCDKLVPSKRGELEIVDLLSYYTLNNSLSVKIAGRGMAWLDTGTHTALLEASHFISILEKRQGLKVGCIEEIAWRKGWIKDLELINIAKTYNNDYGKYLENLPSNQNQLFH